MKEIEQVIHNGTLLALIIPSQHEAKGVEFYTPNDFSQQIASMGHPKGKIIQPHVHNPVPREVSYTKEVLIIKKGVLRVDFYDDQQNYLQSKVLRGGDIILLAKGGHGFEVLEDLQMVEVKQGPYAGDQDKTRFSPIESHQVKL